ncbi:L-serine ammonia-lyase [Rubrivivax gelatinosus]|uniref:L-serine dehydratase n=1 Tax=Rubrivivax gelatinosus TaxID=28068 RepID=A0A4R2MXN2_RUBGE|nr:L-serine ammonia-lyase [Rubrivivax gelatinosus]MBK1686673.1 L-serine ammonia-lyase [Rubrivivax gelatinosus]TCP05303.1 L-serine ammonia-lyase [Rubrivivax gelatinosus]
MISMFQLYKVGIGPSSSHTLGPMNAARRFVEDLRGLGKLAQATSVVIDVYGSLALTGLGHKTDVALLLGLMGELPDTIDVGAIPGLVQKVRSTQRIQLGADGPEVDFGRTAMTFHRSSLPRHENGLTMRAYAGERVLLEKNYYSIGGGFVIEDGAAAGGDDGDAAAPYPYRNAAELLEHCRSTGLSLSGLVLRNELALHSQEEIDRYFANIRAQMSQCMERGMKTEGVLPGPFRVPRRAVALHRRLAAAGPLSKDPMNIIDWVNMFALAVSEENAAGGRVVTAPTNGACGIVPAVLAYYEHFINPLGEEDCTRYFLASAAIGALFKTNASISGAEVGCQGEVGVACSMAAAGLAELLGGSPEQVCIAAEIAMEHNLGLTCDPVGGQVQIPCIERNAMGAVKAINAARMALGRTSAPIVPLDKVIEVMFEVGKDMDPKYRETSCGGLALKMAAPIPIAVAEPDQECIRWAP